MQTYVPLVLLQHVVLQLLPGVLSRPEAAAILATIPVEARTDVLTQLDPLTVKATMSTLRSMKTM